MTKNSLICRVNKLIRKIDGWKLWLTSILLILIVFSPYVIWGETCVFTLNDQMDENILNYVITARHMGEATNEFPEMMGGTPASSLQPFAYLFLPLYRFFNPFTAFVLSFLIVFIIAYSGMYACVLEFTNSNILSCVFASFFSLLPFFPVYGAAVAGIPLVLYAVICISKNKNYVLSLFLIVIFGLTVHIAYGYATCAFWAIYIIYLLIKNKKIPWKHIGGFLLLLIVYVITNMQLVKELLLHDADYISHREEFVSYFSPFWSTFKSMFLYGGQHADSYHFHIIIPYVLAIVVGLLLQKKMNDRGKKRVHIGIVFGIAIIFIAMIYAFLCTKPAIDAKNAATGVLHSFNFSRFYWMLPSLWWLGAAVALSALWPSSFEKDEYGKSLGYLLSILSLVVILLPSFKPVAGHSYFNMNLYARKHEMGYADFIPWESFYADDVMSEIEAAIGEDMSTYRIAHLGMNPTPALMHGFYTIDGYAGNYPLEYKHKFREIIADELEVFEPVRLYFDEWGSRCYLFNSQSGTSFLNGKDSGIAYEGLKFDWKKMKEVGCNYIFSCGEIKDYSSCGLEFVDYFTSDTSFWGIWVYKLV